MQWVFENIQILQINSIRFLPIFRDFFLYYKGKNKENSILLAYLLIPILTQEEMRKALLNNKETTTLIQFKKRLTNSLFGLQKKIIDNKSLTNEVIQIWVREWYFHINDEMWLEVLSQASQIPIFYKNDAKIFMASKKLARMLSKDSIVLNFISLWINSLWNDL